jgi:putative endonuclease
MYYVYILQSEIRKSFYIGSTVDIPKRLLEHNRGGTPSTKPYRPWKVVHIEEFADKSLATKREWYLKHPIGYLEKRKIVEQYSKHGGFA